MRAAHCTCPHTQGSITSMQAPQSDSCAGHYRDHLRRAPISRFSRLEVIRHRKARHLSRPLSHHRDDPHRTTLYSSPAHPIHLRSRFRTKPAPKSQGLSCDGREHHREVPSSAPSISRQTKGMPSLLSRLQSWHYRLSARRTHLRRQRLT